jgi:iron complex outermembrane receptor protein
MKKTTTIFLVFLSNILILWGSADSVKVSGIVLDAESKLPLDGVKIKFSDDLTEVYSDTSGNFEFYCAAESNIFITAGRVGYKPFSKQCHVSGDSLPRIEILLYPQEISLDRIVVRSKKIDSKFSDLSSSFSVLDAKDLQRNMNQTLASTLQNEVGVAVRSMGPAIARPVIKGLGSNRIVLAQDGILSNDLSSTSPDHAVSIEPYSAERIEILRGPQTVLYTSSISGGVINVAKNESFTNKQTSDQYSAGLFLNSANLGRQANISASVPTGDFSFWTIAGINQTEEVRSPIGKLDNTSSDNKVLSVGTVYNIIDLSVAGYFETFNLDYGVPGGFLGSHPNGADIEIQKNDYNLRLDYHLHYDFVDNIELLFQRSYYHHTEFESNGAVAAEFVNRMYYSKLIFNQKEYDFSDGKLNGSYGIDVNYHDRKTGGYVFTPPAQSLSIAPFIFEDLSFGEYFLQAGIRFSYDHYNPRVISTTKNPDLVKDRDFLNIGAGISMMKEFFDQNFLGLNIYHSEKAPTLEELYSEGPHLAAYSYEIGNSDLEKESGNGVELFYYLDTDSDYFMASVFYDSYDSFIIARNTGEINYSILLPIYQTSSVDAELFGFDAAYIKNKDRIRIESNIGAVYGRILTTEENLPMIPPLKGRVELSYNGDGFSVGANCNFAAEQNRVDEFEERTAGFVVFGLVGVYSFDWDDTYHLISISFDNIFDSIYYNHLSRIKSIMPEPGRNIKIRYKFYY